MEEFTARTETVALDGGRVLHLTRFRDPTNGRDRLTLVTGFSESSPLPTSPDQLVEVPGSVTSELVDALRSLDSDG